ncbi:MAG: hypothetical protein ACRC9K_24120 [Afipia sp.]
MGSRVVVVPTEEIGREIANFTIGFAKLVVENKHEDAIGAGSGTLVVLGKVYGIVTAAHVLDALPDYGPVGLVRYQGDMQHEKQTLDMAATTKLVIPAEEFGLNGPDLGFLRIPEQNIGWLKAILSFYNLRRYRDEFIAQSLPAGATVYAVAGMIDERTKNYLPQGKGGRRKGFEAIFTNGDITAEREVDGYGLLDFIPVEYPDFKMPGNFEGTSGGCLAAIFRNGR